MTRSAASGLVWYGITLIAWLIFSLLFPVETLFGLLNLLLGVSCLFLVFCATPAPYSLMQVFALASLVLLAIVPRVEMNVGIAYWGASTTVFYFYPQVTLISLIAVWLFLLSWRSQQYRLPAVAVEKSRASISGWGAVVISAAAVLLIFDYNGYSYTNVIFRGGSDEIGRASLSQSERLIYAYFLYSIPSITLVLYLLGDRRRFLVVTLLFSLVLLGNPPTGMPRWQAAMLYLAILISFAPRVAARRNMVAWALFLGLFALFPILDLFRYFKDEIQLRFGFDWILAGHFDSMQNFARAIESGFVSWGWQLLGVFGFFIPRSVWPGKPIGSGHELAGISDLGFSNIAMNFFGEGYVNFGIIGVFVFAISLGILFGRLDSRFWQGRYNGRASEAIYLFLIGGTFFLVRGDLMSSFAYISSTLCSIITVRFLLTRRLGFGARRKRTT